MKKRYLTATLVTTALLGAICGQPILAGTMPSSMEAMSQQMQDLIDQNQQLTQRVGELEGKMAEATAKYADKSQITEHKETTVAGKISDFVTLAGLVETELAAEKDFEGDHSSSLDLAIVELGLEARATDWAAAHILIKYEDDDLFIDEASVVLGNSEEFPLLLTVGRFYMPFGNFATNMIHDPFTLEIGEINDDGVTLGFEAGGFTAAVYGYQGLDETGASDSINGLGAMAGYGFAQDDFYFNGGLSWINNMADSDGVIATAFDEAGLETIEQFIGGLGAHLNMGIGPFSLIGEYVTALDRFTTDELLFVDQGAEPSAWNTELAYTTELLHRETVFALAWQQTDEAQALGLPASGYSGAVGMKILPDTTLSLEYAYDRDYDIDDCGDGDNAQGFVAQLAYEF